MVRIGRSNDNQVVLYSAVVSRYHVELRQSGKTWEVVNVGTNGTYMDGKRVTQMPIVDGSIIRLARSGPNIQINLGTVRNNLAAAAIAAQPVKLPEEMPLTSNEPPE
jgi:eukaryotic-like serine/threonine-protein kinase